MVLRSFVLFLLAGAAEIVGGWLVWQFWRNGRNPVFGVAGLATLALYGIIPTYQPTHFGRAYAAYGGVFIVLSLAWWIASPRSRRRSGSTTSRSSRRRFERR